MTQDVDKITSFEVTSRYTPGHLLGPFGWAANALVAMVEAEPTLLSHLFELDCKRMHLIALAISHLNEVSPDLGLFLMSGFRACSHGKNIGPLSAWRETRARPAATVCFDGRELSPSS